MKCPAQRRKSCATGAPLAVPDVGRAEEEEQSWESSRLPGTARGHSKGPCSVSSLNGPKQVLTAKQAFSWEV